MELDGVGESLGRSAFVLALVVAQTAADQEVGHCAVHRVGAYHA